MAASEETALLLRINSLPEFRSAAEQAAQQMAEDERVLCAGLAGWAATPTDRPVAEFPSPYYAVTTSGVHFGLLLQKRRVFSKASARDVFIPRDSIIRLITDHIGAVDLLDGQGNQLATFSFRDGLSGQFVRDRKDPSPMHAGHRGQFAAPGQLRNFAHALGLALES